jgi:hypothetical protein
MMFWRKKTGPLALPKPAFNQSADPARAKFAQARFGNSCRTLSLRHPEGDNLPVYRQIAWLGPENGWRVFEISAQLPETGLPPQSRIKADRLDFISAVENIAEWQAAQVKLGFQPEADEEKKLGISYFIPFGEREHLAFDVYGLPHVTANGEIVTEGYFTEETRARIRAETAKPAPLPDTLHIFPDLLGGHAPRQQDLDAIMLRMQNRAAMGDLVTLFKEITRALESIFENDFPHIHSGNKMKAEGESYYDSFFGRRKLDDKAKEAQEYLRRVLGFRDSFEDYFERRMGDCEKAVKYLRHERILTAEENEVFRRMCVSYRAVYFTMYSHYMLHLSKERPGKEEQYMKAARECAHAAEQVLRENGANDTWAVKAFLLSQKEPKLPPIFREFIAALEQSLAAADETLQTDTRRALAVQPHAALPKP